MKLTCTSCGHTDDYALASPSLATPALLEKQLGAQPWPDGWDGFFTPTVVTCTRCGAIDTYELARKTRALGQALDRLLGRSVPSRLCVLHDGTIPRRPSEALAHLRALAEAEPSNGARWRRLGNFCEHADRMEEAVEHWQRAVEVDKTEAEAAYSLAMLAAEAGDAATASQIAEVALCRHPAGRGQPGRLAQEHLICLVHVLAQSRRPNRMMLASWVRQPAGPQPIVNVSTARLDRIDNWMGMVEFLLEQNVLGVGFGDDTDEDEPTTMLEAAIDGLDLDEAFPGGILEGVPAAGASAAERRAKKQKRKQQQKARRKNRR